MLRYRIPVVVWKVFHYRCEVCGKIIQMYLQEGVEGPNREECIPSPFSISCPNGCNGLGPMIHIAWHMDIDVIPPRLIKEGEYVFLYDHEAGCGRPAIMKDTKNWIAETFYPRNNKTLRLSLDMCDMDKLEFRLNEEKMFQPTPEELEVLFKKFMRRE
jgi:hypothetical protein